MKFKQKPLFMSPPKLPKAGMTPLPLQFSRTKRPTSNYKRGTRPMYEPTFSMTVPLQSAQLRSADISLIRAALFGAIAPPLLGTVTFMLLMMENWIGFPSLFFLLFMFLQMSVFVSVICAPFGVSFAVLCGMLARVWLRQGNSLPDVQMRLSGMGTMCGLLALWGVDALFNSGTLNPSRHAWPLAFWGAALIVGALCGWLLPRAARSSQSIASPTTR